MQCLSCMFAGVTTALCASETARTGCVLASSLRQALLLHPQLSKAIELFSQTGILFQLCPKAFTKGLVVSNRFER